MFEPSSWLAPLDLAHLFAETQPLEVELGTGDGSFLAAYAAANPAINFIGVERLLGRLRKVDRKGLRGALKNLRLLRIEASYFIQYLLPRGTVQAVHLYFPDPWPKRRHRARRLVNSAFIERLEQVLTPEGMVYLRTDDSDYFAQMTDLFSRAVAFRAAATPDPLLALATDFERGFQRAGQPIFRQAFRRSTPALL